MEPSPHHDTPERDAGGDGDAPELSRRPVPKSSQRVFDERGDGQQPLELVPLAVAVEREGDRPPPPPAKKPLPLGPILGGIGAVVLVALAIVLGPKLLSMSTKPPPPGSLVVESTPSEAKVLLNGVTVGETPWAGENPAGGVNTLTLRKAGYDDLVLHLDGGVDWSGAVKLHRVKGGR